jgi:hypothetical protein
MTKAAMMKLKHLHYIPIEILDFLVAVGLDFTQY